jgi:hypothetical protein
MEDDRLSTTSNHPLQGSTNHGIGNDWYRFSCTFVAVLSLRLPWLSCCSSSSACICQGWYEQRQGQVVTKAEASAGSWLDGGGEACRGVDTVRDWPVAGTLQKGGSFCVIVVVGARGR